MADERKRPIIASDCTYGQHQITGTESLPSFSQRNNRQCETKGGGRW